LLIINRRIIFPKVFEKQKIKRVFNKQ